MADFLSTLFVSMCFAALILAIVHSNREYNRQRRRMTPAEREKFDEEVKRDSRDM